MDCFTNKTRLSENIIDFLQKRNKISPLKFICTPRSIRVYYGGAHGVIVIVVRNGHGDTSSILDEIDCISHSTNTLGKGMNPIILLPYMGK